MSTNDPYLTLALRFIEDPTKSTSRWHRVVAVLLRRSIETSMDTLMPELSEVRSQRARLLILQERVDRDLALQVAETYSQLSTMIHHHAYELAPNRNELVAASETATVLHDAAQ